MYALVPQFEPRKDRTRHVLHVIPQAQNGRDLLTWSGSCRREKTVGWCNVRNSDRLGPVEGSVEGGTRMLEFPG